MTDPVLVPEAEAIASEALVWPERAKALIIRDNPSYLEAGEFLKTIRGLRGRIGETLDPHIKRAYDAHKALVAEKARAEGPLVAAENTLKAALAEFDIAQEQIRQAEEARLRVIARRDEEERRLAAAAALEAEGRATGDAALLQEAERMLDAPLPVSVVVAKTTPKLPGVVYRDHWTARVLNLHALVAWVAAHPGHDHLLKPNTTALDSLARALREGLKIDGVEAQNKPTVAVASGR
jgi:hypothetical protein